MNYIDFKLLQKKNPLHALNTNQIGAMQMELIFAELFV